jgi:hypothetical protein
MEQMMMMMIAALPSQSVESSVAGDRGRKGCLTPTGSLGEGPAKVAKDLVRTWIERVGWIGRCFSHVLRRFLPLRTGDSSLPYRRYIPVRTGTG